MSPHERRRTLFVSLAMAVRQAVKSRSRSTRLTRFFASFCSIQRLGIVFRIFLFFYVLIAFTVLIFDRRFGQVRSFDYPAINARFPYLQNVPSHFRSRPASDYNELPHPNDEDDTAMSSRTAQVTTEHVQVDQIPQSVTSSSMAAIVTTTRTTESPKITSDVPLEPPTIVPIPKPRVTKTNTTKPPVAYNIHKPPIILGFSIHGGVGNQIYDMLEALYLVRHAGTVMLLPAVLPRTDIEGEVTVHSIRSGTRVWDLRRLAEGTGGRPIYPFLPARCRGRIHILYLFIRRHAHPPTTLAIPTEVRNAACSLARAAPSAPSSCPNLFKNTIVRLRRQNLTNGGDLSFIRELSSLRGTSFPGKAPRDPLCVWVSGHTYDRAGADGDEYLYSHMHFLAAHPRIVNAARKWPLESMAVVHIRYDEELCDADENNSTHVCVRAHKDGRLGNRQVYWSPINEYVAAVSENVINAGATTLYIAASPYVPVKTVTTLRREFSARVAVQRMASNVFKDEADINFLERELAIRSKVFVGDFGSTWSGTVYFKRRTLGSTSLWANVLLGRASNLGYYAHTTPLEIPD